MKFFTNKNITKKLIIVLAFLTLFNFCYPKTVRAEITIQDIKNTLLTGTAELFFSIFDGIMEKFNNVFMGYDENGVIYLSPENIIKGKFILMEANIFKTVDSSNYYDTDGTHGAGRKYTTDIISAKTTLRKTVLGWYYNIRNLAIVAMLSILVYVAIRMILSSVSADKAKYKMMLKDWLVALCLIFAMHTIMIGVLGITDMITGAISGGKSTNMAQKERTEINNKLFSIKYEGEDKTSQEISEELSDLWGHIFIYAAILVFTVIFTIKYLIRAITITFLILLAPIGCITYPIDKMGDGKSQAFDFWFKEFFMEVIIQPFHLLLYMVLIGAAVDMADTNIIYTIICFAIMLPAEKFIKQMFGINEKLGSPLADMASVAAASGLARKAAGWLGKGSDRKKGGSSSSSSEDSENALPPRQRASMEDYDEGERYDNGNNNQQQRVTAENNNEQEISQREDNNRELNTPNNNQNDTGIDEASRQIDKEALEEQIDPENLTPEQQSLLGMNDENNLDENKQDINNPDINDQDENNPDINDQDENNPDEISDINSNSNQPTEEEKTPIQRQGPKPVRKLQQARNAIKTEIGKDVRKKYGTTSAKGLGKRTLKAAPRALGKVLNGATRLTLAAGAAGILGMMALATGDYKKVLGAVGAGAALGNSAGKRINGYRTNINGRIGRYSQVGKEALKGEDKKRKEQKQKYIQNQKERNYVEQYLQDKNGYIPSGREINEEMEKRWKYQEAGITDRNIIDNARDLAEQKETDFLNNAGYTEEQRNNYNDTEQMLFDNQEGMESQIRYRDAYEQLQNGDMTNEEFNKEFGEGEAEKARDHQIMEDKVRGKREIFEKQSLLSAGIASEYSKSDFMDRKKMENLQESRINDYMLAYKAQGKTCSREHAEMVVNSAINDAAKIRGVKSGANLPGIEERPNTQRHSQQQRQQRPTQQQQQRQQRPAQHQQQRQQRPTQQQQQRQQRPTQQQQQRQQRPTQQQQQRQQRPTQQQQQRQQRPTQQQQQQRQQRPTQQQQTQTPQPQQPKQNNEAKPI